MDAKVLTPEDERELGKQPVYPKRSIPTNSEITLEGSFWNPILDDKRNLVRTADGRAVAALNIKFKVRYQTKSGFMRDFPAITGLSARYLANLNPKKDHKDELVVHTGTFVDDLRAMMDECDCLEEVKNKLDNINGAFYGKVVTVKAFAYKNINGTFSTRYELNWKQLFPKTLPLGESLHWGSPLFFHTLRRNRIAKCKL